MAEYFLLPPEIQQQVLAKIKGGVLASFESEEGDVQVLVEHNDKFEWLGITDCLPVSSARSYRLELAEVYDFNK